MIFGDEQPDKKQLMLNAFIENLKKKEPFAVDIREFGALLPQDIVNVCMHRGRFLVKSSRNLDVEIKYDSQAKKYTILNYVNSSLYHLVKYLCLEGYFVVYAHKGTK